MAHLALSQGRCEIFEKGHNHKFMKFLIIVYFHVSMALWIIRAFSFFLNSASNTHNIYSPFISVCRGSLMTTYINVCIYIYIYIKVYIRFPVSVRLLAMCRGKISAVMSNCLMSNCLWSGWKWWWGVKEIPSSFFCCPVNRECWWRKTQYKFTSKCYSQSTPSSELT